VIIAEDVEGEALATPRRQTVCAAASRLQPSRPRASAIAAKAMLQDIAVLTGGQAISEDLGIKMENVTLAMLGRAKKVNDRQGEHHHRQRCRQEGRHRGTRGADQGADRGNHLRTTTARSCRSVWPSSQAASR